MLINGNWFTRLKDSKTLTVKLAGAIAISSTVGTGTYVGLKDTVVISINGEEQVVSTHASTVEELLAEQDIIIGKNDYLFPGEKTEVDNDLEVNVVYAKSVQLTVDEKSKVIASAGKNVGELLKQQGIVLTEHDQVTPSLETPLSKDLNVVVNKGFEVPFSINGDTKKVWSTSTTVADFLTNQAVSLAEHDQVSPSLSEKIIPGIAVTVTRVEKNNDVVETSIPFETQTQEDKTLLKGKKKVIQTGKVGKKVETYQITKENGQVSSRKLVKTETIQEPVIQIVKVGTKVPSASSVAEPATPGIEMVVEATAYSPWCNGCSGRTATGINIADNPYLKVIAVDPRVIKLGSRVWVEGYGVAIAGDTGGAIKGNKIDILMPSEAAAYKFGRKKVRIKVL